MKKSIIEGIAMITQLGITMMVPIFLSAFLGYKIDQWLSTNFFVLIFLFIGFLAAFRNAYYLTKKFYMKDKSKEDEDIILRNKKTKEKKDR